MSVRAKGFSPLWSGTQACEWLAPELQQAIRGKHWDRLQAIQTEAIQAVATTDDHLILSAGTASGKTEAAMLPVLSDLIANPREGFGCIYIGPLKALINDQFNRALFWAEHAGVSVTAWHGDVAQSRKAAALRRPSGVLQITPESLEGIVLNRAPALFSLFGHLGWVVIDEMHAFMGTDRGGQILSLLDRLAPPGSAQTTLPRRIGLSATLGDYRGAEAWLRGGTPRAVRVLGVSGAPQQQTLFLTVDHVWVAADSTEEDDGALSVDGMQDATGSVGMVQDLVSSAGEPSVPAGHDGRAGPPTIGSGPAGVSGTGTAPCLDPGLEDVIYDATRGRRSLVFVNAKRMAERVISGLRARAARDGEADIYHVHHGSLAAILREEAEAAMRDGTGPVCTAATMTLEMGIDIGALDRVLQVGPPGSVSSFVQRLGRAGRRGQDRQMLFFLEEDRPAGETAPLGGLEEMPWELLQTIAVIQLYIEARWIEPALVRRMPGNLLYHQLISVLASAGDLRPEVLVERVARLSPFGEVSRAQIEQLVTSLVDKRHLDLMEDGTVVVGTEIERMVRSFRFLATFHAEAQWRVQFQGREIGVLPYAPEVEHRFSLAGQAWEVQSLAPEQRIIAVVPVRRAPPARFSGSPYGSLHDRVVERMRELLASDTPVPYLSPRASTRLVAARQAARAMGIVDGPVLIKAGKEQWVMLPWCGSRALETIDRRLQQAADPSSATRLDAVKPGKGPYIRFQAAGEAVAVQAFLAKLAGNVASWRPAELLRGEDPELISEGKFDPFLPIPLLQESFADARLAPARGQEVLALVSRAPVRAVGPISESAS